MEHAEKMLCSIINFCFDSSRTRQRAQSRVRQQLFFMCSPIPLCPSCFTVCTTKIVKTRHEGCCCTYLTGNDLSKLLILNMSLGNKAGIMQSMSRGNHMISSAIWDKSARVNLEHAEIYVYVLLGLKLLVWFEIRPKLPFEIAKFSHSNTVFFISKNILFIQYSAGL